MQRRRLALRQKVSAPFRDLPISATPKDQIGARHYDESPSPLPGLFDEIDGREKFLQSIIEGCASNVAVLDESGNILYVSKPWRLSAEPHCLPSGRNPLDLNYLERWNGPESVAAAEASPLAEDIQDILDARIMEFHNEYWRPTLTGSRWFMVHATRLDLPGSNTFRVLVNSDDTTRTRQTEKALRDLGGRLITAQEEERSRVARELHDDLNQRMALLSIELEQLSQRIPTAQDNIRQSVQNLWATAQEISSEIHRVSYQLHPSKLDHLGLVAAVKSLCLELGAHHEIKIVFKERGCSSLLPKDVTLCLFRIIQESFRNAIKHSGAREIKVSLAGAPDVINLSVSDNGRGFDVESRSSRNGLGLISMKERLRLVDGAISIHSSDRGTKIEVSVPLAGHEASSAEVALEAAVQSSANRLLPLTVKL
ncbi:MAG TPA: sensor histidine kinase [Pyrinomonadaceae bacterium]|nr:sensor histidine kinase [Pyrinomonadaceae bacterium]